MNSHLHAIALAALLATAGTAQAQSQSSIPNPGSVIVYGVMAVDMVHITNVYAGNTGGNQDRIDNSTPVASRLGFKGAEDLGGGLSAIFNL